MKTVSKPSRQSYMPVILIYYLKNSKKKEPNNEDGKPKRYVPAQVFNQPEFRHAYYGLPVLSLNDYYLGVVAVGLGFTVISNEYPLKVM